MIRVLKLNDLVNPVGNLLLKSQVCVRDTCVRDTCARDTFKIKESCIKTLAALPQSNSNVNYLIEALQTEQDAEVLSLILKNIAPFKKINFNNTIEKFLTHPAPSVFVEASLCLYHHPKYLHKFWIEKKIIKRLKKRLKNPQLPDTALYLYALGELRCSHYSNHVSPFLNNEEPVVRLAAFTAFIRMREGQLEPYKYRLIKALDSPDKSIKIAALRALKECQTLRDWSPIIQLLGARDRNLVNKSKELLRWNLGKCKSALVEQVFSEKISAQQRFEILSLIYIRLSDNELRRLRQGADDALKKFLLVSYLLRLHELLGRNSKTYELIRKILQEIAEDHLLHVLTIITFAAQQDIDFYQRVSRGLLSSNPANQGNALEVLSSNAMERYLVNRVLKCFEERLTDTKALCRAHLALFHCELGIDNYKSQLLALDNDMLQACLLYIKQEKTGQLEENVKNVDNNVIRGLLMESGQQ